MNNPTQFQSPIFPISMLLCLFGLMTPGLCHAADGAGTPELTLERDANGDTILHRAARDGDSATVQRLLADPTTSEHLINAIDRRGETALHIATQLDRVTIPQELFESHQWDAIHAVRQAVLRDRLKIAEALMLNARFTAINATTPQGNTALHNLCTSWQTAPAIAYAAAQLLLDTIDTEGQHRFSKQNALNSDGLTPLCLAIVKLEDMPSALERHEPHIFQALLHEKIEQPSDISQDRATPDNHDGDESTDKTKANKDSHETHLQGLVDPNVGTNKRSPKYYWLIPKSQ